MVGCLVVSREGFADAWFTGVGLWWLGAVCCCYVMPCEDSDCVA